MNVIIADDSMVVRSIVEKAMTPLGYRLFKAAHGGEVIEILEKVEADVGLILMDWNMPTMDGFQALVRIKADRRFFSIPVVMLTSESDDNKVKKAYDAGAAGYVKKPFTREELIENVQQVLKD